MLMSHTDVSVLQKEIQPQGNKGKGKTRYMIVPRGDVVEVSECPRCLVRNASMLATMLYCLFACLLVCPNASIFLST